MNDLKRITIVLIVFAGTVTAIAQIMKRCSNKQETNIFEYKPIVKGLAE